MRLPWFVWHVSIFDTLALGRRAFVVMFAFAPSIDRCHQFFRLLSIIKCHSAVKSIHWWNFSVSLFRLCLNTLQKDKTRGKKALAGQIYINKFAVAAAPCFLCGMKSTEKSFLWQNVNVRLADDFFYDLTIMTNCWCVWCHLFVLFCVSSSAIEYNEKQKRADFHFKDTKR